MVWNLKKVKTKDLKEFAKNPRKLTKKGLTDLKKSIKAFGIAEPIVINKDYTIIGGHGRKKVLEELNIEEVDCYIPEKELTEKQAEELCVRLNKNIAGEFDFDILANEFEIEDLQDWGFDELDFGISEDFSDKNKEIDIDDINDKSIIKLQFTGDEYLEIIEKLNAIRKNNESNEVLFVRMLNKYEQD